MTESNIDRRTAASIAVLAMSLGATTLATVPAWAQAKKRNVVIGHTGIASHARQPAVDTAVPLERRQQAAAGWCRSGECRTSGRRCSSAIGPCGCRFAARDSGWCSKVLRRSRGPARWRPAGTCGPGDERDDLQGNLGSSGSPVSSCSTGKSTASKARACSPGWWRSTRCRSSPATRASTSPIRRCGPRRLPLRVA